MVTLSGEGGGCCHLAHDHVSSFFSFSAFVLFSYLASKNVLFHPVQTILDNSIKFLDSHHITHANFVKKCDQLCPIGLLTEKRKTIITILWEIVYRSGLEKYKKFFSTYKKILWCNISIVTGDFTFIHCSMICFSSIIEFFCSFVRLKSSSSLPNLHALLNTLSYSSLTFLSFAIKASCLLPFGSPKGKCRNK